MLNIISPDIVYENSNYYSKPVTVKFDIGSCLAYGFGFGILIDDFSLSMRYYSGDAEVQAKSNIAYTGLSKGTRSVSILQFLVGIAL